MGAPKLTAESIAWGIRRKTPLNINVSIQLMTHGGSQRTRAAPSTGVWRSEGPTIFAGQGGVRCTGESTEDKDRPRLTLRHSQRGRTTH